VVSWMGTGRRVRRRGAIRGIVADGGRRSRSSLLSDRAPGPGGGARAMTDQIPSDHSLLRRFRRGQDDAPTQLYLRYAARLRALATAQTAPGLAARVDPEDIVQSVFRTFFRRAAEGQYDVPEGEEIWKLLLVIALHKIRAVGAFHRAARRDVRLTATGTAYDRAVDSEAGHDDEALAVLRMVIDDVLDALPPGHRPIVELRVEGHEVAEIAERVRRSKRTVERVLQEFRQRLDAQVRGGD
jgi:RNA polymerase sigma-70 factor, ECF subfamily